MAVVFESREEEMMKKITEKAMKVLAASPSPPCKDFPDELKKYVIKACRRCIRRISIAEADPDEVQECLFEELANMYFEGASKKTLEQLKRCLKDLSKACSDYEDEAR
jgi:uncharacterized protein Yka (UPF0111/DUF47 family)